MYDDLYLMMFSILGIFLIIFSVLVIVTVVLKLAGLWMIVSKAGRPGWSVIIPLYGNYVISNVVLGNANYFIAVTITTVLSIAAEFSDIHSLLWITNVISLFLHIFFSIKMAKSFGKSTGFTIGLIFLPFIFLPILGFGKAQYIGPS